MKAVKINFSNTPYDCRMKLKSTNRFDDLINFKNYDQTLKINKSFNFNETYL